MSTMSEFPTEPVVEVPPLALDVSSADDSDRLAALYRAYPEAKAAADEATSKLKAITDGIKVELTARAPQGTARFELSGTGGTPLALRWQVTRRFDSKGFAKSHPDLYEQHRTASGSWVLAPAKAGE